MADIYKTYKQKLLKSKFDTFDFTQNMIQQVNNDYWKEKSNLWTIISAACNDAASLFYVKLREYVKNLADIDVCTIHNLKSIALSVDTKHLLDFADILLTFPVELRELLDILSIKPSKLLEIDQKLHYSSILTLLGNIDMRSCLYRPLQLPLTLLIDIFDNIDKIEKWFEFNRIVPDAIIKYIYNKQKTDTYSDQFLTEAKMYNSGLEDNSPIWYYGYNEQIDILKEGYYEVVYTTLPQILYLKVEDIINNIKYLKLLINQNETDINKGSQLSQLLGFEFKYDLKSKTLKLFIVNTFNTNSIAVYKNGKYILNPFFALIEIVKARLYSSQDGLPLFPYYKELGDNEVTIDMNGLCLNMVQVIKKNDSCYIHNFIFFYIYHLISSKIINDKLKDDFVFNVKVYNNTLNLTSSKLADEIKDWDLLTLIDINKITYNSKYSELTYDLFYPTISAWISNNELKEFLGQKIDQDVLNLTKFELVEVTHKVPIVHYKKEYEDFIQYLSLIKAITREKDDLKRKLPYLIYRYNNILPKTSTFNKYYRLLFGMNEDGTYNDVNYIQKVAEYLTDICIKISYIRLEIKGLVQQYSFIGTLRIVTDVVRDYFVKNFSKRSSWRYVSDLFKNRDYADYIKPVNELNGLNSLKQFSTLLIEYFDQTAYLNILTDLPEVINGYRDVLTTFPSTYVVTKDTLSTWILDEDRVSTIYDKLGFEIPSSLYPQPSTTSTLTIPAQTVDGTSLYALMVAYEELNKDLITNTNEAITETKVTTSSPIETTYQDFIQTSPTTAAITDKEGTFCDYCTGTLGFSNDEYINIRSKIPALTLSSYTTSINLYNSDGVVTGHTDTTYHFVFGNVISTGINVETSPSMTGTINIPPQTSPALSTILSTVRYPAPTQLTITPLQTFEGEFYNPAASSITIPKGTQVSSTVPAGTEVTTNVTSTMHIPIWVDGNELVLNSNVRFWLKDLEYLSWVDLSALISFYLKYFPALANAPTEKAKMQVYKDEVYPLLTEIWDVNATSGMLDGLNDKIHLQYSGKYPGKQLERNIGNQDFTTIAPLPYIPNLIPINEYEDDDSYIVKPLYDNISYYMNMFMTQMFNMYKIQAENGFAIAIDGWKQTHILFKGYCSQYERAANTIATLNEMNSKLDFDGPWVYSSLQEFLSLVELKTIIEKPLTFTALSHTELRLNKVNTPQIVLLQYKINDGDWMKYVIGSKIELNLNDTVAFSGNNNYFSKNELNYYQFDIIGSVDVEGSIQSLINYNSSCSDYCFINLFKDCATLYSVPELPAVNLGKECYKGMFENCFNIETAPELPSIKLTEGCYQGMFKGCISLTGAPKLPAIDLATSCYEDMFIDCSSMKTAPLLPASSLVDRCYANMFVNCEGLVNYIKVNFTNWSDELSTTDNWVSGAALNLIFKKPPKLQITLTGTSTVLPTWEIVNLRMKVTVLEPVYKVLTVNSTSKSLIDYFVDNYFFNLNGNSINNIKNKLFKYQKDIKNKGKNWKLYTFLSDTNGNQYTLFKRKDYFKYEDAGLIWVRMKNFPLSMPLMNRNVVMDWKDIRYNNDIYDTLLFNLNPKYANMLKQMTNNAVQFGIVKNVMWILGWTNYSMNASQRLTFNSVDKVLRLVSFTFRNREDYTLLVEPLSVKSYSLYLQSDKLNNFNLFVGVNYREKDNSIDFVLFDYDKDLFKIFNYDIENNKVVENALPFKGTEPALHILQIETLINTNNLSTSLLLGQTYLINSSDGYVNVGNIYYTNDRYIFSGYSGKKEDRRYSIYEQMLTGVTSGFRYIISSNVLETTNTSSVTLISGDFNMLFNTPLSAINRLPQNYVNVILNVLLTPLLNYNKDSYSIDDLFTANTTVTGYANIWRIGADLNNTGIAYLTYDFDDKGDISSLFITRKNSVLNRKTVQNVLAVDCLLLTKQVIDSNNNIVYMNQIKTLSTNISTAIVYLNSDNTNDYIAIQQMFPYCNLTRDNHLVVSSLVTTLGSYKSLTVDKELKNIYLDVHGLRILTSTINPEVVCNDSFEDIITGENNFFYRNSQKILLDDNFNEYIDLFGAVTGTYDFYEYYLKYLEAKKNDLPLSSQKKYLLMYNEHMGKLNDVIAFAPVINEFILLPLKIIFNFGNMFSFDTEVYNPSKTNYFDMDINTYLDTLLLKYKRVGWKAGLWQTDYITWVTRDLRFGSPEIVVVDVEKYKNDHIDSYKMNLKDYTLDIIVNACWFSLSVIQSLNPNIFVNWKGFTYHYMIEDILTNQDVCNFPFIKIKVGLTNNTLRCVRKVLVPVCLHNRVTNERLFGFIRMWLDEISGDIIKTYYLAESWYIDIDLTHTYRSYEDFEAACNDELLSKSILSLVGVYDINQANNLKLSLNWNKTLIVNVEDKLLEFHIKKIII